MRSTTLARVLLAAFLSLTVPIAQAEEKESSKFPECAQRAPSVSLDECEARMALATVAPLTECKDLVGKDYRLCAVKVPSKIHPPVSPNAPPAKEMTEMEKMEATRCDRIKANGGYCNDDPIKAAQKRIDEANLERNEIRNKEEKRAGCLRLLKIGDSESKVLACGYPDHINSDRQGDDQWVYSDHTYVYINKKLRVTNVQWRD